MAKQAQKFTTKSGILLGPSRIEFPHIYEGNPDPVYGKGKFMATFRNKKDEIGLKTLTKLEKEAKALWAANFPGTPFAPGRLPWTDGDTKAKSIIAKGNKPGQDKEKAEKKASYVKGSFEVKATAQPKNKPSLYAYKPLGEDGTTKAPLPKDTTIDMGDIVRYWVTLGIYIDDETGDPCMTCYLEGVQLISKGSVGAKCVEDEEVGDFAEEETESEKF